MKDHDRTVVSTGFSLGRWRTLVGLAVLLIVGIVATSYFRPAAARQIIFFDAKMEQEYRKFKTEMLPELKAAAARPDQEWKKCCPEVLSSSDPLEMQHNAYELKEKYAACILFDGLERSIPAVKSFFHHEILAEEIRSNLDLTSCVDSIAGMEVPVGVTFAEFEGGRALAERGTIVLETEDWIYAIEIIAAADIDHDGLEDIAVLLFDKAKQGSFHVYSPKLLSRRAANGRIVARSIGYRDATRKQ